MMIACSCIGVKTASDALLRDLSVIPTREGFNKAI